MWRGRKHPRGVLGDDHVLPQKFHDVKVWLPEARAAAVLQLGFPILDATADQRRQQEQQQELEQESRQIHRRVMLVRRPNPKSET
jgi:hypothetical protein